MGGVARQGRRRAGQEAVEPLLLLPALDACWPADDGDIQHDDLADRFLARLSAQGHVRSWPSRYRPGAALGRDNRLQEGRGRRRWAYRRCMRPARSLSVCPAGLPTGHAWRHPVRRPVPAPAVWAQCSYCRTAAARSPTARYSSIRQRWAPSSRGSSASRRRAVCSAASRSPDCTLRPQQRLAGAGHLSAQFLGGEIAPVLESWGVAQGKLGQEIVTIERDGLLQCRHRNRTGAAAPACGLSSARKRHTSTVRLGVCLSFHRLPTGVEPIVAQCLLQGMEGTAQPIARLGLAQLGPEQRRQPIAAVRPFLDGQVG